MGGYGCSVKIWAAEAPPHQWRWLVRGLNGRNGKLQNARDWPTTRRFIAVTWMAASLQACKHARLPAATFTEPRCINRGEDSARRTQLALSSP